jgi:hypothetical protein
VHQALDELRDVISVLRDTDIEESAGGQPQPSFTDLRNLVDESRDAGTEVRYDDAVAEPDSLPPATGRTAYRVVQEGLTNARKHAAGHPVALVLRGRPGDTLADRDHQSRRQRRPHHARKRDRTGGTDRAGSTRRRHSGPRPGAGWRVPAGGFATVADMSESSAETVRVLVVDDDALVRGALVMMLDGANGIAVVVEATDGDEVPAAVDAHFPDLVLMDLRLPRVDGIVATRRLRSRPNPRRSSC